MIITRERAAELAAAMVPALAVLALWAWQVFDYRRSYVTVDEPDLERALSDAMSLFDAAPSLADQMHRAASLAQVEAEAYGRGHRDAAREGIRRTRARVAKAQAEVLELVADELAERRPAWTGENDRTERDIWLTQAANSAREDMLVALRALIAERTSTPTDPNTDHAQEG